MSSEKTRDKISKEKYSRTRGLLISFMNAGSRASSNEEKLRKYLANLQNEDPSSFLSHLKTELETLSRDNFPVEKMTKVINLLLTIPVENEPRKISIFSNYLRNALGNYRPSSTSHTEIHEIVASVGKLAKVSVQLKTLTAEWVNFEIERALEWLENRDKRMYVSLLVMKVLAENSPTFFFSHSGGFLKFVWIGLKDSTQHIRTASIESLVPVMKIIKDRQCNDRIVWYHDLVAEVEKNLGRRNATSIQAGLLVAGVLFEYVPGNMMRSYFGDMCTSLVKFLGHSNRMVRKSALTVIPVFCKFDQNNFSEKYLERAMKEVFAVFKTNVNRGAAYVSLGKITMILSLDLIVSYKRQIIEGIVDGLRRREKQKKSQQKFKKEALFCLGQVSEKFKEKIKDELNFILRRDLLFSSTGGLSEALVDSLSKLAENVSSLLKKIQLRLLDCVSMILGKKLFRPIFAFMDPLVSFDMVASSSHLGNSYRALEAKMIDEESDGPSSSPSSISKYQEKRLLSGSSVPPERIYINSNDRKVLIALKTLCTFNMRGHNLIDLVCDVVINYLSSPNPDIRKQVVQTCSVILSKEYHLAEEEIPGGGEVIDEDSIQIGNIVQKLLRVSIIDPDHTIRYEVLKNFQENLHRFDKFLSLTDNLQLLFVTLHDETYMMREISLKLIGRLHDRNPAFVLSSLRTLYQQILTNLEYNEDIKSKEESAKMLGHLILTSSPLTKPYLGKIYKVLRKNLLDMNISCYIIDSIGKLAIVGGREMAIYFNELLPLIVRDLENQATSEKREITVRSLGHLVKNTGSVIVPYSQNPNLLNILLSILNSEPQWETRKEVLKILGIIGAIDPYTHRKLLGNLEPEDEIKTGEVRDAIIEDYTNEILKPSSVRSKGFYSPSSYRKGQIHQKMAKTHLGGSQVHFHTATAFTSLMNILKDQSLKVHHNDVIQAVVYIFTSLGMKCVPFLGNIMGPFLDLIGTTKNDHTKITLFQQLSLLVGIIKHHVRKYSGGIVALMLDNWENSGAQLQILNLWQQLCISLADEFKGYLEYVIPQILQTLKTFKKNMELAIKSLQSLQIFAKLLFKFVDLVVPACVNLLEEHNRSHREMIQEVVKTMEVLSVHVDISGYTSRFMHPLISLIDKKNIPLSVRVVKCMCTFVYQLKHNFMLFEPIATRRIYSELKNVQSVKEDLQKYESLVEQLQTCENMYFDLYLEDKSMQIISHAVTKTVTKESVNIQKLQSYWKADFKATKDDWMDWFRRLSISLLSESPSPALRSCSTLAQIYQPLAKVLFNASFLSCWCELEPEDRTDLVRNIEKAFSSPDLPSDILQILLNLAEFMEHDEKPLPIAINSLGYFADKCQSYAKALHYKEIEFSESAQFHIDGLLSIYDKLQLHEAVIGVLKYAQQRPEIEFKDFWYEKLQRWDKALEIYSRKLETNKFDLRLTLGRMKCLDSLGKWVELGDYAREIWEKSDDIVKAHLAKMSSYAAWNLHDWKFLEMTSEYLEPDVEGCFLKSVCLIHQKQFGEAQLHIDQARQKMDKDISALVGESYNRAYDMVVFAQQLTELEELIQYNVEPDKRELLKKIWKSRLYGISPTVEKWKALINIRRIVLEPTDMEDELIRFAKLVRDNKKNVISDRIFRFELLGGGLRRDALAVEEDDDLLFGNVSPNITFNYIKHMWEEGRHAKSIQYLQRFVEDETYPNEILSKAFVKLGRWIDKHEHPNEIAENSTEYVVKCFEKGSYFDAKWYKAHHHLGIFQYKVASHYAKKKDVMEKVEHHYSSAIVSFFKSIRLNVGNTKDILQDILRLLTVWFNHGTLDLVHQALENGFQVLSVDTWLLVIPQLIARINSRVSKVKEMVSSLLVQIGMKHPQALVYPLTVSTKSDDTSRRREANNVINILREHHPVLIDQAVLVSSELIRIAILWSEQWHLELENFFFGHQNVNQLLSVLGPMYEKMNYPSTNNEKTFQKAFQKTLEEARKWCKAYEITQSDQDLSRGCNLFYTFYSKIRKLLPHVVVLDLKYISPRLQRAKNLELSVPGTYLHAKDFQIFKIGNFVSKLEVISSKHRPRKVRMNSEHGQQYMFFLKGHEDLRQDERVMQLFGLVNTLLKDDPTTRNKYLSIKRYSVVPLSANEGILGFVSDADTIHSLIKEYRDSKGIVFNIEHRIMKKRVANLNNLTLMQKVEVFEHALQNTKGDELKRVMWLKSGNSEIWLDRRTNYTRSLAVSSIVGYILGLGDRHPNNIMIEKHTGKVVHIDFGDCFEIAMHRDNYPERIPFRLTRMLVQAMEICGYEGTYRLTCERVMKVMRVHKSSVMAMLEAFVYDPLINWRLIKSKLEKKKAKLISKKVPNLTPHSPNAQEIMDNGDDPGRNNEKEESVVSQKSYTSTLGERELLKSMSRDNISSSVNNKALSVIRRIESKLDGTDFTNDKNDRSLQVGDQVQMLIDQATQKTNLAVAFIGWCPFW